MKVRKAFTERLKVKQDQKNPQRFPRFKKKGQGIDSFRYRQDFKLDGDRVFLPKGGWVRFINSREIEGTPGNVTVSRRGDHWQVSIQTERQAVEPRQKITRLPRRIADAGNDSLHNASSTIGKNHAVVCIEDVKIRDMFRSASATSEAPGKKVRGECQNL